MPETTVRLTVQDNFTRPLEKFATETGQAEGAAKKFSTGVKQSGMSLTELSSGIGLAKQSFGVLKGVFGATAGATVDYAKQVRDLGRTIGATAEESSKLIQAADDVKVSYEALSTGLETAVRKGFDPSIAGLGRLADQYNAIQDPIARAKFAMDTFGRAGADLAPLLEKGSAGIRALGEEAEALGLVMSGEGVQSALEYEQAVDELTDAWTGFKITLGTEVLPAVTDAIQGMNDSAAAVRLMNKAVDEGVISGEEMGQMWAGMRTHTVTAGEVITDLTRRMEFASVTSYGMAGGWDRVSGAVSGATPTIGGATPVVWGLSDATLALADNMRDVATAQDEWGEKAGGDFSRALDTAGVEGEEFNTALGHVDSIMGTSLQAQDDYRDRVQKIADQFARDGNVDTFRTALNKLKDEMQPQIQRNDEYYQKLQQIETTLIRLSRGSWPIDVVMQIHNFGTDGPTPIETIGAPGMRQSGGLLGPGYAMVGEQGPELIYMPAGGGRVVNNFTFNNSMSGELDIESLARRVMRYARDYNG